MANKYHKIQPKVHPLTIVSIVGFFVLIFGLIWLFQPTDSEKIYSSYELYADTEFFTEDHPFVTVEYKSGLFKKGLDKLIDQEDVLFLYIGSAECTGCQAVIGAFEHYYLQFEMTDYVDQIYYLNASEQPNDVTKLAELYDEITTTTPQFIVFVDGVIVETYTTTSSTDRQDINYSVYTFFDDVEAALTTE